MSRRGPQRPFSRHLGAPLPVPLAAPQRGVGPLACPGAPQATWVSREPDARAVDRPPPLRDDRAPQSYPRISPGPTSEEQLPHTGSRGIVSSNRETGRFSPRRAMKGAPVFAHRTPTKRLLHAPLRLQAQPASIRVTALTLLTRVRCRSPELLPLLDRGTRARQGREGRSKPFWSSHRSAATRPPAGRGWGRRSERRCGSAAALARRPMNHALPTALALLLCFPCKKNREVLSPS